MVKKVGIRCGILLFLMLFLSVPAGAIARESAAEAASSETAVTQEWQDFCNAIPAEVAELLPDRFFDADLDAAGEGVKEAGSLSAILQTVAKLTGLAIRENLALLAGICGVLVLSAVLRTATAGKESGAGKAASFCAVIALTVLILGRESSRLSEISAYFDTVKGFSATLLPLMGTLYAMGGNVSAAVAHHGVMSVFLTVIETICSSTVVPIAGICLTLTLTIK